MPDHAQTNGSTINKEPASPFLKTVQAARLLKRKPKTLENMRWKGEDHATESTTPTLPTIATMSCAGRKPGPSTMPEV